MTSVSGVAVPDKPSSTVFGKLLDCGLVVDPSQLLAEKTFLKCGKERKEDEVLKPDTALVFTHHTAAPPVQVRLSQVGPLRVWAYLFSCVLRPVVHV